MVPLTTPAGNNGGNGGAAPPPSHRPEQRRGGAVENNISANQHKRGGGGVPVVDHIPKPAPLVTRNRANSFGSTRGAFGPLPNVVSPTKQKRPTGDNIPGASAGSAVENGAINITSAPNPGRKSRKKKRTPQKAAREQPQQQPVPMASGEMNLGDVASLAMATMGTDDLADLLPPNDNVAPMRSGIPPPAGGGHPLGFNHRASMTESEQGDHYFEKQNSSGQLTTTPTGATGRMSPNFDMYARVQPASGGGQRGSSMDSLRASNDSLDPTRLSITSSGGAESLYYSGSFDWLNSTTTLDRGVSTASSALFGDRIVDDIEQGLEDIDEFRDLPQEKLETLPGPTPLTAAKSGGRRGIMRHVAKKKQQERADAGAAFVGERQPPPVVSSSRASTGTATTYGSTAEESFAPPPAAYVSSAQQQQEIALFASMVQQSADYGEPAARPLVTPPTSSPPEEQEPYQKPGIPYVAEYSMDTPYVVDDEQEEDEEDEGTCWKRLCSSIDPNVWLSADIVQDEDGTAYYEEPAAWRAVLRHFFYKPEVPEFTSLQQFSWAIFLGVFMGFYTALWKTVIEFCVEFMWKTVPEKLYDWGLFTDLDGAFPLPHYMWICPAIFGGVLSYIFVILPKKIPGQNEWIQSLHARGVQDHETFWTLLVLSTAGMASGLSLGPELPLVLTAGMIGSYIAVVTRQSILSARAMNLTAASAAIGGFFGFPMAGALFVLEIPHRMGLQYFEALSPATIASIMAVLVNRICLANDVTGYFTYPFLTTTLPSHIFYVAIVYGLVGSAVGVLYVGGVQKLKHWVHDLFHKHDDHAHDDKDETKGEDSSISSRDLDGYPPEKEPLIGGDIKETDRTSNKSKRNMNGFREFGSRAKKLFSWVIPHEPSRAAVAGTLAGLLTGIICMFFPHILFWGEAQLQNLIDKGRTPLPVFGQGDEPTADLTAYGFCMIDEDDNGFTIGCAALLIIAKIFAIGLSLGTGIIGGHFWGPLFVGCLAGHLLTDVMSVVSRNFGFGTEIAAYPCVAILCIMGSTHVVTFRAHMAIMLILTLTISAFGDGSGISTAGDYSAVFPLLVVACFVSLMLTRDTIFYESQRCRGDIMAAPEVLCEPGKEGMPMVLQYGDEYEYGSGSSTDDYLSEEEHYDESTDGSPNSEKITFDYDESTDGSPNREKITVDMALTQNDIENAFKKAQIEQAVEDSVNETRSVEGLVFPDKDEKFLESMDSSHLEENDLVAELLLEPPRSKSFPPGKSHRRVRSASDVDFSAPLPHSFRKSHSRNSSRGEIVGGNRSRSNSVSSRNSQDRLTRVSSFGEISDFHPSLFAQARARASSAASRPPALPKSGRHSRKNSDASSTMGSIPSSFLTMSLPDSTAALSQDDVERSFSSVVNQQGLSSSGGRMR